MRLQGAPTFSPEDYPDVPEALLQRLTEAFDELYSALSQQPESQRLSGRVFTTDALGSAYCDIKNPLPQKPQFVEANIRPDNVSTVTGVWSMTWLMAGDTIRILFVGLAVDTKYIVTVKVE